MIPLCPDPMRLHPIEGYHRVVYLKPLIRSPYTSVGEFTYYDDPHDSTGFESNNVLYHTGPDRLVIGKYCSLAAGVSFIMSRANHRMSGVSTYPFPLFGGSWSDEMDLFVDVPTRGDTVVDNDVWIGHGATIMPGIHIGDGAIIGARSVVTSDVPSYGIVAGNPARLLRRRYSEDEVRRLSRISWWDWPVEQVTANVRILMSGSVDQ